MASRLARDPRDQTGFLFTLPTQASETRKYPSAVHCSWRMLSIGPLSCRRSSANSTSRSAPRRHAVLTTHGKRYYNPVLRECIKRSYALWVPMALERILAATARRARTSPSLNFMTLISSTDWDCERSISLISHRVGLSMLA